MQQQYLFNSLILRNRHSLKLVLLLAMSAGFVLKGLAQASDEWAGSEVCAECHEDRHASWYKTYHRTMTQAANTATVRGRFDAQPVTYWGVTIRPVRRNNQFWFDYYLPGDIEPSNSFAIVRTVGSHRYQQYLTQIDGLAGNYYRLHLLWHIEDQRWVHMNGAFLSPDEQGFDDNVALWNHNCIFCHNTGPVPNMQNYQQLQQLAAQGQRVDLERQSLYDSSVSELGISCETCHGPSSEHVRVNRNPFKRLWNKFRDRDSSIVHPDRLNQQRSVQVCGQCHGQRTPKDMGMLDQWVHAGPAYRAGADLLETVKPVSRDTQIPGDNDPDRFRLRFWSDGTPRLTAYEYQGLLQSRCYMESQSLTCSNCHSMHGGDPDGMTTEWQRGNGPCLECHQEYQDEPSVHTMHATDSSGSQCTSCHMPNMVYGVMTIHPSHKIEVPNPQQNAADQRPNACNQCHLDRSVQWAEQQLAHLWGGAKAPDEDSEGIAAGVQYLFAGDPVQRAVTAWSLQQAIDAKHQPGEWWAPHLLTAMRDDQYPAVRRFAAKALRASVQVDDVFDGELKRFDFIAAAEQREQVMEKLIQRWQQHQQYIQKLAPKSLLLDQDHWPDTRVAELQTEGLKRSVGISVGE